MSTEASPNELEQLRTRVATLERAESERRRLTEVLEVRARQQAAVADLGQRALEETNLDALFALAVQRVTATLDVEYAKVLELLSDGQALRLRAGVGWQPGIVGQAIVDPGTHSQVGYTLHSDEPVIVDDLRTETRFLGPALLTEHSVVSGVSVTLHGREQAFGVLGVYTTQRRTFSEDDIQFLRAVANVLAGAVERARAEAEQEVTRVWLEAVVRQMPVGVILAEAPSGRLILGNPQAEAILRRPLRSGAETSEYGVYRSFHPDGRPYRFEERPLTRALTAGEVVTAEEIAFDRGDGSHGTMTVRAGPVRDSAGHVRAAVMIFDDVTRRKQEEAAWRERKAYLQLLVEHLPAHVWTTDADLQVTRILGTLAQQLRIDPGQYLGKTIPELLEAEGGENHPVVVAHRRALAGETAEYERGSAGRHFEAHIAPLPDGQGRIIGCVGLALDVSDRKRAEQRRAAQYAVARVLSVAPTLDKAGSAILGAIANSLGWEYGALWTPDPTNSVLRCLASWHAPDMPCPQLDAFNRRTSFLPREGLPGQAWTGGEPIWIADAASAAAFPRLAIAAQEGLRGGFALPIHIAGSVVAVCEFFGRDVRQVDEELLEVTTALGTQIGQFVERTALERRLLTEEEVDRVRTIFLQTVSHELRTPLTALQAGLGLLQEGAADRLHPEEQELLANARRNAILLDRLTDDLLTASQLEVGSLPLDSAPVDLRTVVVDATATIGPLIQAKQQLLEFNLPERLPIRGDSRRLGQVVMNLLMNANRYTPSGTRIAVTGRITNGKVSLTVRDEGPGIPAAELEAVFRPFYRLGRTGGAGLGLAIAKSIIELHGGRIWVENGPGAGSVFHIALPHHADGGSHELQTAGGGGRHRYRRSRRLRGAHDVARLRGDSRA